MGVRGGAGWGQNGIWVPPIKIERQGIWWHKICMYVYIYMYINISISILYLYLYLYLYIHIHISVYILSNIVNRSDIPVVASAQCHTQNRQSREPANFDEDFGNFFSSKAGTSVGFIKSFLVFFQMVIFRTCHMMYIYILYIYMIYIIYIYIWYIHTYITLHYITYIYIYIIQDMPWSKLAWYIHIGPVQPVVVCPWWDDHNRSSGPRVRMARVQEKPSSRWGEGKTMGKWENHRKTIGKP